MEHIRKSYFYRLLYCIKLRHMKYLIFILLLANSVCVIAQRKQIADIYFGGGLSGDTFIEPYHTTRTPGAMVQVGANTVINHWLDVGVGMDYTFHQKDAYGNPDMFSFYDFSAKAIYKHKELRVKGGVSYVKAENNFQQSRFYTLFLLSIGAQFNHFSFDFGMKYFNNPVFFYDSNYPSEDKAGAHSIFMCMQYHFPIFYKKKHSIQDTRSHS